MTLVKFKNNPMHRTFGDLVTDLFNDDFGFYPKTFNGFSTARQLTLLKQRKIIALK
jgi:hypothetical protein